MDPLHLRVLCNPADDDLRQVWADALQERGDPLGEVVALQIAATRGPLTRVQEKRLKSLVAKHRHEWLGPLADVIMQRDGLVIDRGVITSCQTRIKSQRALGAAIGDPRWGGVQSIWFCEWWNTFSETLVAALLVHPVFASLRDITGIGQNSAFARLATHDRPLPFTTIWTIDDSVRAQNPRALYEPEVGRAPALPHLKVLGLGSELDPDFVLGLPLVARLETLGLGPAANPGVWLDRATRVRNLAALEWRIGWIPQHGVDATHAAFTYERAKPAGAFSKLTITSRERTQGAGEALHRSRSLTDHVDAIPASVRTIDVRLSPDRTLRDVFRKLRSAEVTFSDASTTKT
jgi:uncharacterized protein (TIGR02996 family)